MLQTILPEHLTRLTDSETDTKIRELRARLGERLVILGHHYQRDEVIKFADIRGDSFKHAQWAGKQKNAEYIVFCGVHFMAESADILSGEHQKVVLPDLSAGCSMAEDRKSTRLNSSHSQISYAVFCLKKKIDLLIPGA